MEELSTKKIVKYLRGFQSTNPKTRLESLTLLNQVGFEAFSKILAKSDKTFTFIKDIFPLCLTILQEDYDFQAAKPWAKIVYSHLIPIIFSALGRNFNDKNRELKIDIGLKALVLWDASFLRPDIVFFLAQLAETFKLPAETVEFFQTLKKPYLLEHQQIPIVSNLLLTQDIFPFGFIAIELLGKATGSTQPEVISVLLRVLKNEFLPLTARKRAIISLGQIGNNAREAILYLKTCLENTDFKFHASVALVQITGVVKEAIPILVESLCSSEKSIAEDAQRTLILVGPEALYPVTEALNDEDLHQRAETILRRVIFQLIPSGNTCLIFFETETKYLHKTIERLIQINNQKFEAYQSASRLLKEVIDTLLQIFENKKAETEEFRNFALETLQQFILDEERRRETAKKLGCVNGFETNEKLSRLKEVISSS